MCYPPRQGTFRYVTHPFAARRQGCPRAAARLACVKHSASVQSEPGSNSSVQSVYFPTHSNESQRPNFYIRPFLLSCKCLLLILLASSSSRSFTSRFRIPLRTQSRSFNPNQPPSLRFRNVSPPPPPAQQAPTPIGCLVFKERYRFVALSGEEGRIIRTEIRWSIPSPKKIPLDLRSESRVRIFACRLAVRRCHRHSTP